MKKEFKRLLAWICTIAILISGISITPNNSIEAETTADGWVNATGEWTTDGLWNIAVFDGTAKYQNNDTLDDYYVNIVTGAGQWTVQSNTVITGLTAGTLYTYKITMESDTEGAYIGVKEEYTNSNLIYNTLSAGVSTTFEGTFTPTTSEAKLFLEMGQSMNSGAIIHITGVEVEPYSSSDEQSGNITEGKAWKGWFEKENWSYYTVSENSSGYTLTDKNIGENWYSIQTGIDNVEFNTGKTYTCSFTLTAANPKEFTVDNRSNDAVVFTETAGNEWVANGDGTYSYNYVGKYTPTASGFINVRIALGYHNNKNGKTDANYEASSIGTFTVSDFQIVVDAGAGTEPTDFVNGEEILNRIDFGDGCLEESEATYNDDDGLWIETSASGALYTNKGDGSVLIAVPAYLGAENNYDTQLKQHAVHLKTGKSYRIRYAVSSDVDKTVQFLLQNYSSWEVYKSQNTIVKAGTTEYVEFVYTHTGADTTTALFGLMLGPINGPCTAANVTISDVSLIGYDTLEQAENHPKRVIEIISNATSDGKISMYWNVAGGNTNAPEGQVYNVEVDGEMVFTNLQYTSAELTEMSTGGHTITVYSKLGEESSTGYTITVIVPEAAKTAFGITVDQVTNHDKDVSIGSGWTYNFPLTGSDNFIGVDSSNNMIIYSPTANENAEYIYRTVTDLTVGKYYTYSYTITGDKQNISIPILVSSGEGYLSEYTVTAGENGYICKYDFCADNNTIVFRFDVKSLNDAAVKISTVTTKEIEPVAVDELVATVNVDDIELEWSEGQDASIYQTYSISYQKDGMTNVEVATNITNTTVSYIINNLAEGKYVVTITSTINGKKVSNSTQTIVIGAAIISEQLSVEGFQIKTNGTLSSVAYRAICKSPNIDSTVTDTEGKVYTVKEFGTIYVIDTNWSGYLKNNKVSSVYTLLDASSRNGQVYSGAYMYEGQNHTLSYVATSNGIVPNYNNDDDENTYYVQTMTGMDAQMAFGIHVRAFAVATDSAGNEVIVYGDVVASTSVGQIADYFYNNSMATNYVAHEYLFNSILNSKYLTANGVLEANPAAEEGVENNRYYRIAEMEYGWNGNLYGPSVIPIASPWKYQMSTSKDMIKNWNTLNFDDSSWSMAIAPFGDRDIGNIMYNTLWADEYTYLWMRKTFTIKDATDYVNHRIILTTWYDDTPKIYLNGHLIFEDTVENPYKFTDTEADDHTWVDEYVTIDLGTVYSQYLVDGTNVIAIECSNGFGGRMMDCGVTLVK